MPRPKLVDKDGRFAVPVVIDTREQQNYDFTGLSCDQIDGGGPLTVPTVRGTLASGDYSLLGYETRVAIERKSLADLYGTLGQGRERFERELARLVKYDFAAVVIEASLTEIATAPPPHSELNPKTVYRSLLAWTVRTPVRFLPCDNRRFAEVTTFRLLERWLKEELASGGQLSLAPLVAGKCKTALEVAAHSLHEGCIGARWYQAVGVGVGEILVYCREQPKRHQIVDKWHGFPVKVIVIGEITPASRKE